MKPPPVVFFFFFCDCVRKHDWLKKWAVQLNLKGLVAVYAIKNYVEVKIIKWSLPPILALNDTPTPQMPLSAWAATSPAHFVPWLKRWKKITYYKNHSLFRLNRLSHSRKRWCNSYWCWLPALISQLLSLTKHHILSFPLTSRRPFLCPRAKKKLNP